AKAADRVGTALAIMDARLHSEGQHPQPCLAARGLGVAGQCVLVHSVDGGKPACAVDETREMNAVILVPDHAGNTGVSSGVHQLDQRIVRAIRMARVAGDLVLPAFLVSQPGRLHENEINLPACQNRAEVLRCEMHRPHFGCQGAAGQVIADQPDTNAGVPGLRIGPLGKPLAQPCEHTLHIDAGWPAQKMASVRWRVLTTTLMSLSAIDLARISGTRAGGSPRCPCASLYGQVSRWPSFTPPYIGRPSFSQNGR